MNEWKNGIKLRACDSMDGRIFNNRTHWNIRCKFLEVGLRIRGFDKIRENPDQNYEKQEGGFFIYIPIRRNKKRNEENTSNGSCPVQCSLRASSKPKVCLKLQNVNSSGNAKNIFIHRNKTNKESPRHREIQGRDSRVFVKTGTVEKKNY